MPAQPSAGVPEDDRPVAGVMLVEGDALMGMTEKFVARSHAMRTPTLAARMDGPRTSAVRPQCPVRRSVHCASRLWPLTQNAGRDLEAVV
jgi:hypothetical protein